MGRPNPKFDGLNLSEAQKGPISGVFACFWGYSREFEHYKQGWSGRLMRSESPRSVIFSSPSTGLFPPDCLTLDRQLQHFVEPALGAVGRRQNHKMAHCGFVFYK